LALELDPKGAKCTLPFYPKLQTAAVRPPMRYFGPAARVVANTWNTAVYGLPRKFAATAGGLASIGGAYVLDFDTWFPLDLFLGCGGMLALGFGLILMSR
jgi:hypothetical protein